MNGSDMHIDKSGWVVGKVLAEHARVRPNQKFLQFQDGRPYTFGEIDAIATRVGNALLAMGIKQGERVAVMMPNCLEYVWAWFGLSRMGAVLVGINTAYKGTFLTHVLKNAGCEVVIMHPDYLPWLADIEDAVPLVKTALVPAMAENKARLPKFKRIRMLPFEQLMTGADTPIDVEVTYRDIGMILFTSGTTGPSKGVLMSHAHLYLFALLTGEHVRLTPQDRMYICMPLFHGMGLLLQLYNALRMGCTAVLVPIFSATAWLSDIRKHRSTVTFALGAITEFILRQPPTPQDADNDLRLMVAVPVTAEVVSAFKKRFGVEKIMEGYGMTEVNMPLWFPYDDPPRPGSCGKPEQRFFDVRIVDPETDEPLPAGSVGEIVVQPKEPFCFMQGYNGMPEKTVETWRNFWFHTGDAGRIDEDGYFWFIDRIKDSIRRRGENISSYEVEFVLAQHPAVAEAAAVAMPSEYRGGEDEVLGCLVLKPGVTQPRPEEILDFCLPRMPHFAVPRYIQFLNELPKTPSHKVQKQKLREHGITPDMWDRESVGYQVKRR